MSAAADPVARYLAEFETREADLPGAALPWLRDARRGALARFAKMGFPAPRAEHWKYTRVAPIEKRRFAPAGPPADLGAEAVAPFALAGIDCHRLVFVDGIHAPALSSPGDLPAGLRVESIAGALAHDPEQLRSRLSGGDATDRHAFTALNRAFSGDGALVHLARDAVVAHPVHLLFLSSGRRDDVVAHPRVLIVAEPGSRAVVVETYDALAESVSFQNVLTEVSLGATACVEHYKVQRESARAFHVATLDVRQGRGSRFTSHSISFGGALTRNDINVSLDAEGADCTLNGLYMVDGRQHVDFHTVVDHAAPACTSRERYKGILSGHSRGVFNGRVHVHPDAQKSDASQSNDNLLLSRDAEVDTKPELEIHADDVKCAHGATIGQLDEHSLFYLRTRGLPADAARGLLTYGFAQDLVDHIEIAPLRESLTETLLSRLPHAAHVREIVQ